jgi:hypothetical protein
MLIINMKVENLKPSALSYYQTRASILHPVLAITQVNIGIYLLFAAPYINTRFITVAAPLFFRQICCFFVLFILSLISGKLCSAEMRVRDAVYCIVIGIIGVSLS